MSSATRESTTTDCLSYCMTNCTGWIVPQRVDYKLCSTVHGCLQRKAPPYLVDLCTPVSDIASRQHLRSASSNQLVVPRHRRTEFGRRAFSVAGTMAWNALPDSITDTALSTCSFRRYLKTSFLLLLAYQRIRGIAFMRYINPRLTLTMLQNTTAETSECNGAF